MKFNPLTKSLFTDDLRLIKRLHCPFRVDWSKLNQTNKTAVRSCDVCEHHITDTASFSDEEMLALLAKNSEACLKVNLNQDNVAIIYQDEKS